MSRKGNCWDNAVMERFFLNLKMERVWQRDYANHAEATRDIADYTRQLLQQRASALHTGQLATQCLRAAIGNQTTYRRVRINLTRTVFPEPGMTVAAIDRLVHHSTIFELNKVENYRSKAAARQQKIRRDTDKASRRRQSSNDNDNHPEDPNP